LCCGAVKPLHNTKITSLRSAAGARDNSRMMLANVMYKSFRVLLHRVQRFYFWFVGVKPRHKPKIKSLC
jgi:hypothetical protein